MAGEVLPQGAGYGVGEYLSRVYTRISCLTFLASRW